MILKRIATLLSLVFALASTAYAASPGFYIGAQLGFARTNYSVNDFATATPPMISAITDNSGTGARGTFGYQFNDNWAAELGFTGYGRANYNAIVTSTGSIPSGNITSQAWDVVGKGIYPSDNGVAFFAKLGLALVRAYNTGGLTIYNNMQKTRPTAALGLNYDFNPNVCADVSFSRVFKGSGIENSDLTSVGLYYHFG